MNDQIMSKQKLNEEKGTSLNKLFAAKDGIARANELLKQAREDAKAYDAAVSRSIYLLALLCGVALLVTTAPPKEFQMFGVKFEQMQAVLFFLSVAISATHYLFLSRVLLAKESAHAYGLLFKRIYPEIEHPRLVAIFHPTVKIKAERIINRCLGSHEAVFGVNWVIALLILILTIFPYAVTIWTLVYATASFGISGVIPIVSVSLACLFAYQGTVIIVALMRIKY